MPERNKLINYDDYISRDMQNCLMEGFKTMSDDEIADMANHYSQTNVDQDEFTNYAIVLFCFDEINARKDSNQSISPEASVELRSNNVDKLYEALN